MRVILRESARFAKLLIWLNIVLRYWKRQGYPYLCDSPFFLFYICNIEFIMMTHLHRFSHSADVKQFTNTIIQLVRFACWCFALVAFMFELPKAGISRFDLSVYASLETIVQSIPNLMFSSWALAIVALEAWVTREGGMRLIIFSTIALVAVLVTAYGLNIIYINYLHPAGIVAADALCDGYKWAYGLVTHFERTSSTVEAKGVNFRSEAGRRSRELLTR